MELDAAPAAAAGALPALAAGVVAGLAVALPLGAVGVLLLQEGMSRGRRAAMAAATGVATVDLVYAGAAVPAGGAVAAVLAGREGLVRLVGAAVLAGLAVRGLRAAARPTSGLAGPSNAAAARGAFWRFAGLTALNPLTAVYFTVLAAGLGEGVRGPASAFAFVLGVFAGSWTWQTVLGLAGALAGVRLPARARTWTSIAGYGIVLALAIVLALSA
jgi:threonine/homoserine/homoserine lactone efflux protein